MDFRLEGVCDLTGRKFSRTAPCADEALRNNIRAHTEVWGSTPHSIAEAIQIDPDEFVKFMTGDRGAELEWVTRLAAYSMIDPAQILTPQTQSATNNALQHLEFSCSADELTELVEGVVAAKRAGMLTACYASVKAVTDAALELDGIDAKKLRALARRLTEAA